MPNSHITNNNCFAWFYDLIPLSTDKFIVLLLRT